MRRLRPLVLGLLTPALFAWGDKGHRTVTQVALKGVPPELGPWFQGRELRMLEASVEPDRWKSHDRKEGPRHYLNVELYGKPSDIPHDAGEALAKVGGATFQKAGTVPWVIQDGYRRLVEAFRSGDPGKVAEQAAWLGHYVADLHVPLHTTANHDGQLTGQKGLHARWESGLVERYVEGVELPTRPSGSVDPAGDPWIWLEESFSLVPRLLADDLEASRGEARERPVPGVGYWRNFWALQGDVVQSRLSVAGHRLAALWGSAWVEAGRPRAPKP